MSKEIKVGYEPLRYEYEFTNTHLTVDKTDREIPLINVKFSPPTEGAIVHCEGCSETVDVRTGEQEFPDREIGFIVRFENIHQAKEVENCPLIKFDLDQESVDEVILDCIECRSGIGYRAPIDKRQSWMIFVTLAYVTSAFSDSNINYLERGDRDLPKISEVLGRPFRRA